METLALHFDFTKDPLPDDPDMTGFRQELSRSLEKALTDVGAGRWRGGRYARGVVTLFIEVPDARSAMIRVRQVLDSRGLANRMTIGSGDCLTA